MLWGILIWFFCGLIAMSIGQRKGEGFISLILGWIFGPLGVLVALASSGDRYPCPYCKEPVRKKAIICPHCRQNLEETNSSVATTTAAPKTMAKKSHSLANQTLTAVVTLCICLALLYAYDTHDNHPNMSHNPGIENVAMPLNSVGECADTSISEISTRLENMPESGSAITYANGAYGVSYEEVPAISSSKVGDPIHLCLTEIEKNCAPDDQVRSYSAQNTRTGKNWELATSSHQCDPPR